MQKTLKWTSAQPIKRPDNIISSKARETGDIGFKPSYLAERREDMNFIMSNEYMRLWFKERGKYEKNTYSKVQIIKEESKIKRRFVQRMMTYRKPQKTEILDEKFQKTPNKGQTKKEPIDYSRFKYKPVCLEHTDKGVIVQISVPKSGTVTKQATKQDLGTPNKGVKPTKSTQGAGDHSPGPPDQNCCGPCCPNQ